MNKHFIISLQDSLIALKQSANALEGLRLLAEPRTGENRGGMIELERLEPLLRMLSEELSAKVDELGDLLSDEQNGVNDAGVAAALTAVGQTNKGRCQMSNTIKLNDNAELHLPCEGAAGVFRIFMNNCQLVMTSNEPHIDTSELGDFYMASATTSGSSDFTSWNVDITREAAAALLAHGLSLTDQAMEALSHE